MNWTVLATICHVILVGTVQTPACHQEIAGQHLDRAVACNLAQAGIAQWKANSKFADDEFYVGGWQCVSDTQAVLKGDL